MRHRLFVLTLCSALVGLAVPAAAAESSEPAPESGPAPGPAVPAEDDEDPLSDADATTDEGLKGKKAKKAKKPKEPRVTKVNPGIVDVRFFRFV